MNKCLAIGDILTAIAKIGNDYQLPIEELKKVPVYIGDDDELNGIHTAFCIDDISELNPEYKDYLELIAERNSNVKPGKISLLIS